MLAGLGRFAHRFRWVIVAVWVAAIAAGAAVGGSVYDRLTASDALRPDAESAVAERLIDEVDPEGTVIFAVISGREPYDPVLVDSVLWVSTQLREMPGVVEVHDLYNGNGGQVGANGDSLLSVELAKSLSEDERVQLEDRVIEALHGIDAPSVLVGGETLAERAFADQAIQDAAIGESVAIVLVALGMILMLGGFVAGGVPLVAGLATVATALAGLWGLTFVTSVNEYTANVVTLLGLGLAIDYALLLLFRYREERRSTSDQSTALAAVMRTSGRAVLVSGVAVAAAFSSLTLLAEPLLAAMAAGGAIVAVIATLGALTLVPALIAVAGRRIGDRRTDGSVGRATRWVARQISPRLTRRNPRPSGAVLGGLARFAQRRPGLVTLATIAGLVLLALPLLGARFANSDHRALPADSEVRQAQEAFDQRFPAGGPRPVTVVVKANAGSREMLDYLNVLNQLEGVRLLALRPDLPADLTVIDLTPDGATDGPEAREIVRAVRALPAPAEVLVTGPASEVIDYQESLARRLPLVALGLLVISSVLLFLLTRSLVIPLKALVMNVLTLAATLGVLVLVFQHGWGTALLGFESWGAIDLTTPVLLFVFVFALTMDYEVFLLSRITERWRETGDNDSAVIQGIRGSGRAVSAAALCMIIVFLGFVVGDLVAVKEIGVGMIVAIALDVTVVRGLLLPAAMTLLGRTNWWPGRGWNRGATSVPKQTRRTVGKPKIPKARTVPQAETAVDVTAPDSQR